MKQNITTEQLNELTKEQSDKLFGWMGENGYLGSRLSIGQMIEILEERRELVFTRKELNGVYSLQVSIFSNEPKEEICDFLWEAVKEALVHQKE